MGRAAAQMMHDKAVKLAGAALEALARGDMQAATRFANAAADARAIARVLGQKSATPTQEQPNDP